MTQAAQQPKMPNWQKALDELGEGGGPFFFLKSPKTNVRLICLEDDPEKFFAGATTVFKGKPKTKYVVFALILKTQGRELSAKYANKIVPLVLTKTAIKSILSLLSEGYDLFDPAGGYGITIMKSGAGTDTEYNIMPSPQPVPFVPADYTLPEKSLIEYADELTNNSAERSSSKTQEDW